MKIACQEGLAPGKTFAERLENLARYGFDGVELNGGALLERAGIEERKAALKDSPVKASSICGGITPHFISTDREKRRQSVESAKKMLDAAAELGAVGPIGVPIFRGEGNMPDLSPFMTRQQLREAARKPKPGRPKHYVFAYRPTTKAFQLKISFAKSRASRDEIIDALEAIVRDLRKGK